MDNDDTFLQRVVNSTQYYVVHYHNTRMRLEKLPKQLSMFLLGLGVLDLMANLTS